MQSSPRHRRSSERKDFTYRWSYDEDVTGTKSSLKNAEKITGNKLSDESVYDGGVHLVNSEAMGMKAVNDGIRAPEAKPNPKAAKKDGAKTGKSDKKSTKPKQAAMSTAELTHALEGNEAEDQQ